MELVPDTPTSVRHRIGDIPERKQGTARGTRTKNCRTAVRQIGKSRKRVRGASSSNCKRMCITKVMHRKKKAESYKCILSGISTRDIGSSAQ